MREDGAVRYLEGLFEAPWRLVLVAALLVGVPVLVLGEVTAADTRARLQAAQLDAASAAAERGVAVVGTRIRKLLQQVEATGQSDFGLQNAVNDRDLSALAIRARDLQSLMGPEVAALTIYDAGGASLAGAGTASAGTREYFTATRSAVRGTVTVLEAATDESQRAVIAAPIRRAASAFVGLIAVEVRLRDAAEWLQPGLAPSEDLYVIDDRGRLLAQATKPVQAVRDVGAAAFPSVAPADVHDPIAAGRRFVAAAAVPGVPWRVVASRSPDAVERELGGALNQLLALRVALVAVLLLAAYAFARVASGALHQRRALAAANAQLEESGRELAQTNEALAQATAAKSQFLANMSHDLRTPLNAIIGFSDVLLAGMFGELNDKQREYIADISSSGKHQLGLVNDILDLSKVEAGRIDLAPNELVLRDVVEGAHAVVRPLAEAKAQTLALELDDAPLIVRHDAARLRQVLLNLLSNAVKYTPNNGEIRTSVRADGATFFEIAVTDTGVGIASEDLPRLFEEFERIGASYSRSQQGTGLGLALVKRFVELMGGTISVRSELGSGSTFILRLPVSQP